MIVQMDSRSYDGYVGVELCGVEECCEGVEALREGSLGDEDEDELSDARTGR